MISKMKCHLLVKYFNKRQLRVRYYRGRTTSYGRDVIEVKIKFVRIKRSIIIKDKDQTIMFVATSLRNPADPFEVSGEIIRLSRVYFGIPTHQLKVDVIPITGIHRLLLQYHRDRKLKNHVASLFA